MYKDKDKQREANAERQRRYKAKHKGVTSEGVTDKALPITAEAKVKTLLKAVGFPHQLIRKPKRGKDIKCFADLPPDVRRIIEKMSTIEDGVIDQTIKANRTAVAINYQHLYPDRYYSTGVA